MNKKLVIGLVAAGVIAAAGAVYIFTRDNGNETDNGSPAGTNQNAGTATFNPIATDDLSFEAELSGIVEGEQYTATILHDGEGTTKYTSAVDGNTVEFYVTGDTFISCQDDMCMRFPAADQDDMFDQDRYSYNEDDFTRFRESASYQGKQSCPAGTCDVWEVEDEDAEYTTQVYLTGDRRVSKLTTSGGDDSFEIVYTYKDVSITLPQNVQSFPGM